MANLHSSQRAGPGLVNFCRKGFILGCYVAYESVRTAEQIDSVLTIQVQLQEPTINLGFSRAHFLSRIRILLS